MPGNNETRLPALASPGQAKNVGASLPLPAAKTLVAPSLTPLAASLAKPPPAGQAVPLKTLLKAPSILLMGPTGTGKTDVLADLITCGLELFVIVTEPNGLESLIDSCIRRKADINKLHYHVVEPTRAGFDNLELIFKSIAFGDQTSLSKSPPGGRQGAKILEVAAQCKNFTCQRTGQQFGSLSAFGPERAVALDSLSGINEMAMDVICGNKVTASQGEWGIAMKCITRLIGSLTSNLQCMFVLTAHESREIDEVRGGMKIMVSTLGRKLAPDLPKFFSEVVGTRRDGADFRWTTTEHDVDLKRRALPLAKEIKPSFQPIIDQYKKRLATIG